MFKASIEINEKSKNIIIKKKMAPNAKSDTIIHGKSKIVLNIMDI